MLIAVLGLFSDVPFTQLNAVKQPLAAAINLSAAAFLVFTDKVEWTLVAVMAPAALIGGAAGGRLSTRLPGGEVPLGRRRDRRGDLDRLPGQVTPITPTGPSPGGDLKGSLDIRHGTQATMKGCLHVAARLVRPARRVVTDVRVLAALSHPARVRLFNHLVEVGPSTATECAAVAGVTPSACSYHLRHLARFGLVERTEPVDDGGRIDGRQRWWRAVSTGLSMLPTPSRHDTATRTALTGLLAEQIAMQADLATRLPRRRPRARRRLAGRRRVLVLRPARRSGRAAPSSSSASTPWCGPTSR